MHRAVSVRRLPRDPARRPPSAMTFVLVKFLAEEAHVWDLLDGRIYANRLSWFREIDESDDSGRGDKYEGIVGWFQPGKGVLRSGDMDIMPNIDRPIEIRSNQLDHYNLFCTTYGWVHEDVLNGLSDADSEELSNTLLVPKLWLSLGQFAVVIKDVDEFIRRMKEAADALGFVIGHKQVEYYDPETYHGVTSAADAIFRKQDRHSYQQEFRFVIATHTEGNEHVTIEIGDIHDIAVGVRTAELNE